MAGEDPKYAARIRQQPCCGCNAPPPSQLHHVTYGRGIGQRSHDRDGIPLCLQCHHDFHNASGAFKGWSRGMRTEWQRTQVQLRRGDPDAF